MEVRIPKHEIGAGLADMSTIHQKPDMGRLGVPAT
jgi:hypothetical protein